MASDVFSGVSMCTCENNGDIEWLCACLMLATMRNVLSECAAVMLGADHSADVHRY